MSKKKKKDPSAVPAKPSGPGSKVRFAAIDFETADRAPDSACALAIVVSDCAEIVAKKSFLIRPPRKEFMFTWLHHISWEDVESKPVFGDLWEREIRPLLAGVDFLAAHNAGFDRTVLDECCRQAGFKPLKTRYLCTVKLARRAWKIFPTKLNNVCSALGIELDHHNAESDALACAKIVLAAKKAGFNPVDHLDAKR